MIRASLHSPSIYEPLEFSLPFIYTFFVHCPSILFMSTGHKGFALSGTLNVFVCQIWGRAEKAALLTDVCYVVNSSPTEVLKVHSYKLNPLSHTATGLIQIFHSKYFTYEIWHPILATLLHYQAYELHRSLDLHSETNNSSRTGAIV